MSKPVVPGHVWITNWDGNPRDYAAICEEYGEVVVGPAKASRWRTREAIEGDGIRGIYITLDAAREQTIDGLGDLLQ